MISVVAVDSSLGYLSSIAVTSADTLVEAGIAVI